MKTTTTYILKARMKNGTWTNAGTYRTEARAWQGRDRLLADEKNVGLREPGTEWQVVVWSQR